MPSQVEAILNQEHDTLPDAGLGDREANQFARLGDGGSGVITEPWRPLR